MAAPTMTATTPVVASRPADDNAPSFLNLPAEIRNLIYDLLFKDEPALQLAVLEWDRANDDRVELVWRSADDNENDHDVMSAGHAAPEPRLRHQEGLELLRVCRQVHHEAATVLYFDVFLDARRDGFYDRTGFLLNLAFAVWLRQIGQHNSFVRNLVVNLGAVVSSRCDCDGPERRATFRASDGYIHCGTLVNALWASDNSLAISFIDSGPVPTYCREWEHLNSPSITSICNTTRLQKVFQQLGQDYLGLKKLRKGIGEIGVRPDGSAGIIVFRTIDWQVRQRDWHLHWDRYGQHSFLQNAMTFEATENDTLRISDRVLPRKPGDLLALPEILLHMVLFHVMRSYVSYTIELEAPTDFRNLHGIFYVNRSVYTNYLPPLVKITGFIISIEQPSPCTDLQLSRLRRLLDTKIGWYKQSSQTELDTFGERAHYRIDLHLEHCTTMLGSMEDTGFNVMTLLAATFEAKESRTLRVCTHDESATTKRFSIPLQKLRLRAMEVLRDYVDEQWSKGFNPRCPELWMDGQGEMMEVVSTGLVMPDPGKKLVEEQSRRWSAWRVKHEGPGAPCIAVMDSSAWSVYSFLKAMEMGEA